jgi:hypothetical protein
VPTSLYETWDNVKSELLQLYEQGSKVQIDEFWIYCCGIRRCWRIVTERLIWIFCPSSVSVSAPKLLVGLSWSFGIEVLYGDLSRASMNVVEVGSVTILLCSSVKINFYRHVLYFLTDLDEIWYRNATRVSTSSCTWKWVLYSVPAGCFVQGGAHYMKTAGYLNEKCWTS